MLLSAKSNSFVFVSRLGQVSGGRNGTGCTSGHNESMTLCIRVYVLRSQLIDGAVDAALEEKTEESIARTGAVRRSSKDDPNRE